MYSTCLFIAAAVLATLTVTVNPATAQKKGRASPNPRIRVTFQDDAPGARLVSDGGLSYTDCDVTPDLASDCDGLGQIWAGGSEDATFRMRADGRRYHVQGFSPDGWFLNIRNIGKMAVGARETRAAHFSFDGDQGGPQPYASYPNRRFNWTGLNGSLLVVVQRTTSTTWTVSTTADSMPSSVGPTAFLDEQNQRTSKYTILGTHDMPFALSIECLAYCTALGGS